MPPQSLGCAPPFQRNVRPSQGSGRGELRLSAKHLCVENTVYKAGLGQWASDCVGARVRPFDKEARSSVQVSFFSFKGGSSLAQSPSGSLQGVWVQRVRER